MRIYNSLTREIENFKPIDKSQVKIYSCGPTVYNYAHIGNLRAFVFSDLLKKYLRYKEFNVLHVMNITDVDDKTIKGARESGQPLRVYTDKYYQDFLADIKTLNVNPADIMPRATDEIAGMVDLIKQLLDRGFAYRTDSGDIYYKVSAYQNYGSLVQLDSSKLLSNADGRLNSADEYDKDNAQDFALWKAYDKEDGDAYWDTEIGKGRPGWHIECSAMSTRYLGQPFDIHTGGVDLKFPHHTNEMAQSECLTNKRLANYWVHNEHLMVNGKKMSKSLGNFYTLRDLLHRGYNPRAIRFELIKTHYRQQLDFREDHLQENMKIVERFQSLHDRLSDRSAASFSGGSSVDISLDVSRYKESFLLAMDDDLNISKGLAVVYEFIRAVNKKFDSLSCVQVKAALDLLVGWDSILGILSDGISGDISLEEEVEQLISLRQEARRNKDFKKADEIRDQLLQKGIEIKDTPTGVKWHRVL
jgi:cysteinyl-tRNA synthetase